ncbi:RING finger protein [Ceratobasidium sp. AG-Ba]|nr:RING finger protein [Ceratobasidium sp. AG-Ba]
MLTRVAGFCCRVPESRLGWAFHWPAALSPPLNHIEPGIPCELAHSMKYGKTYSTLLSTSSWPQEWRDIALDYSALKKLLNAVVEELAAQGLNPAVLNELLDAEKEYEEHEAYLEQPLDETQPSSSGRPPTAQRDVDGVKGEKPTAVLMSSSVGLVNTSNPLYVLKSEYDRTTEGTAWIEEISSDADDAAQDKDGSSISSSPEFVPEPRQE